MRVFEGFEKGINLGGWISQFDVFSYEHFDTFITEKDIEKKKKMGFDHVRVPVDYNVLEDESASPIEAGYKYLDNCYTWCKRNGIKMIIDVHEVYGYSFDPLKKDMDRSRFFFDDKLQSRFFDLWRTIAKRYADKTDTIAFELLNEVVLEEVAEAWNKVAEKCVAAIREYTKDAYIIIGGVCYNNVTKVPLLDKPYDDRIVYNFHCYEPMAFTHQKAYWVENMPEDFYAPYPDTLEHYREYSEKLPKDLVKAIYAENLTEMGTKFFEDIFSIAVEAAEKNNAPLYCGEYGVAEFAPMEDAVRWYRDINTVFKKFNIGRAMWNYKGKDFGLIDESYSGVKDELIKYI